jgi:hypothetical protein
VSELNGRKREMEDGRKKVKQWNSKKIISCLIVSVLLIAAGTGSVFAYNFIHQREMYKTKKGMKVDDSITAEEKQSDHLVLRMDTSKKKKKYKKCKVYTGHKCKSIDEAEQILGFKIARPQLDNYKEEAYIDQNDVGTEKTITAYYTKGKSSIDMGVMDFTDSEKWYIADNFPEEETVTHNYINKGGIVLELSSLLREIRRSFRMQL